MSEQNEEAWREIADFLVKQDQDDYVRSLSPSDYAAYSAAYSEGISDEEYADVFEFAESDDVADAELETVDSLDEHAVCYVCGDPCEMTIDFTDPAQCDTCGAFQFPADDLDG